MQLSIVVVGSALKLQPLHLLVLGLVGGPLRFGFVFVGAVGLEGSVVVLVFFEPILLLHVLVFQLVADVVCFVRTKWLVVVVVSENGIFAQRKRVGLSRV